MGHWQQKVFIFANLVVRPAGDVIAINDGNLFDVFGISDLATASLDVINLNNGQILQKLNLPADEEL